MLRFSANLGFLWSELPLLERIAAASRAGFKAVELHFPYDHDPLEIGQACQAHGLRLLGVNTAFGPHKDDRGLAAVPGREVEARGLIDQSLEYIRAAGGNAVHVMAGIVPPAQHAEGRRTLVASLRYAVARIGGEDITILLEAINQRDMPGYFYSGIEEAASIIAEVGSDRVRVMYDCYHVGVSQGDVIKRLRANIDAIGHVQIAAVPSRAEPDEGELSYGAILAELEALNYGGWIGCEYRPRAGTDAGLGWINNLGVSLGG